MEALWQGPPALFVKDAGKLAWSPDGRWLALGRRFLEFMDRRDNERRRLGPFESGVLEFWLDSRRLVSAGSAAPSRALLRVWALPEGKLERTLEQANASFQLFANDRWLTFEAEANASETDTPSVVRRFALDGTPPEVLGRFEPRRLMGGGLAIDPSGTWMVSAQGGRLVQQWLDRLGISPEGGLR